MNIETYKLPPAVELRLVETEPGLKASLASIWNERRGTRDRQIRSASRTGSGSWTVNRFWPSNTMRTAGAPAG
jgi:hypothetical protein